MPNQNLNNNTTSKTQSQTDDFDLLWEDGMPISEYRRNLVVDCIEMSDFYNVSEDDKKFIADAAYALCDALGENNTIQSFAVFFEEDDKIAEIITDCGPRRLSVEVSTSKELFYQFHRILRLEIGQGITKSSWSLPPYDFNNDVAWLLEGAA